VIAGYIRPSILWHLLSTNGASVDTLVRLIGRPAGYIHRVVRIMLVTGQVVRSTRYPGILELTVKGLDAARAVDINQVEVSP